jgi:hypothetical protein
MHPLKMHSDKPLFSSFTVPPEKQTHPGEGGCTGDKGDVITERGFLPALNLPTGWRTPVEASRV